MMNYPSQTRVSQALKDILKECRRVVERLDIRKEVKWRPVITENSILFNHDSDSRAKFTEKRKQELKLARLAFKGNTRAFELYCLRDDHIRRQWKYRMKHKMYVHHGGSFADSITKTSNYLRISNVDSTETAELAWKTLWKELNYP